MELTAARAASLLGHLQGAGVEDLLMPQLLAADTDRAGGDEDDLTPGPGQGFQLLHQCAQPAQR